MLLAVTASMYAVYHGPHGLAAIAAAVHGAASALADDLTAGGVEVVHDAFFDTVLARVPGRAAEVVRAARESEVHLRLVDADHVGHLDRPGRHGGGPDRGPGRVPRRAATRQRPARPGWGTAAVRRRT